ncbi:MAG: PLP-dependent aminotransferase family protein, partial [Clostridiales bacterium]|nr:PLP-dependent aminotransferase family protein [Clostridiales bacterium]
MKGNQFTFADRFEGISGSAIREIFKLLGVPGMISFAGGNPSVSALPDEKVAYAADKALRADGKRILQYGATEGYGPFIESLLEYVQTVIGKKTAKEEVLPITGSTQGMDLLCKTLINPGDVILVESPTFLGNMQAMRLAQAKLVSVESDQQGLLMEALEEKMIAHRPKMLYTIPNFQNPTGKTLPLERRKKIAELAEKYGVVVAEDDPYRDLRYAGSHLPTIKELDSSGMVVYLGSFSKIISPGMRVGYLVGDPQIIRKCTIAKQSSDLHTANINQAIIDVFLRENLLNQHIATICKDYQIQMEAMLGHTDKFPEGTEITRPE